MHQKTLGPKSCFFKKNQLKNKKNKLIKFMNQLKLNRYTYKLDFKPDLIIVNVFLI
jgi:hypothetical protein